ncbi:uncharacterized protein BDCG_16189 [Blastomyces dermatitidis ER-3]|uniref:Uncharacterized protein n=2 Tax=Ajellomyces dermatitidis TaxID=5039 RepID=A0A0J9HDU7_AJEDA|nr:uncharacterized protein BDCG_16189 [Blastomyces dermatitidis ER-3]EEQ83907.2 hypothetical protein BDCG_16189 [Blastomyces dermatitidis ER-3]KMW67219.1 hypothetical protein BDDG_11984 [Blastomyces dermatitidis ATCC 18188]
MAKKDARNRHATFYDKDLKPIAPVQCLDAAIEDGTNTVFMAIGGELNVDENMVASASQVLDIRKRLKSRACEDPRLENQLAEEEEEL